MNEQKSRKSDAAKKEEEMKEETGNTDTGYA
jgi:hypothetical protein